MQKIQGWSESGGVSVVIPGTQGSGAEQFQQSFRGATVTVYAAGTTNLSLIYSDNVMTAKANPFTADSVTGLWSFYAPNGTYDIKFSGGGIAAPFTLGDVRLFDSSDLFIDVTASPYNATGNGSTNDAAAIQAAIDAAQSTTIHRTVLLPSKTSGGNPAKYNLGSTQLTGPNGLTMVSDYGGADLLYAGTSDAIDLGNASAQSSFYKLQGFRLLLSNNAGRGIKLTRVHNWNLENLYIEGNVADTPNQQNVAITLESMAANSLFGHVRNVQCQHVKTGVKLQCTGGVNGITTIVFDGLNVFGDDISGSKGIDYGTSGCGDGFVFLGGNLENLDYGVYANGGAGTEAHFAKHYGLRFESNLTADIYLGAFEKGFLFAGCTNVGTVVELNVGANTFIGNTNNSGLPTQNQYSIGSTIYTINTTSVPYKATVPNAGTQNLLELNYISAVVNRFHVDHAGNISALGGAAVGVSTGSGSPEGVVTKIVGSLYLQTDGSTSATLWIKASGTGNTGWDRMAGWNANRQLWAPYSAAGDTSILLNTDNTGTGRLFLQAGGKSANYGGSLSLYSNAHATKPGDVAIGLSGGNFRVNADGLDASADRFTVSSSGVVTVVVAGFVSGAPTGGAKGTGTINIAADIYKNNTAYTNPDYAFEHYYKGVIEKFRDNPGASSYRGLKTMASLQNFVRRHFRLPGVHKAKGAFARSDVVLEKVEEAYLYIFQLNERLAKLEAEAKKKR